MGLASGFLSEASNGDDEVGTVGVGSVSKLYVNPSRKKIRGIGDVRLTGRGYFFVLDATPVGRTIGFKVDQYRCYLDSDFGIDAGCY